MFDVLIIGGGAAGFYAAIHIAEGDPELKIAIIERGKEVLTKVKVSGGGRCNVIHAEFDPSELVKNYPRGEKELLGPFHRHSSFDTLNFFKDRGIDLKMEGDGRMFPISNSSQTIIDCFVNEAKRLGIKILMYSSVIDIASVKLDNEKIWQVTSVKKTYTSKKLLVATGSNPKIWDLLKKLGHTIETPVASLFTFKIKDDRIRGIQGLSTNARVELLKNSNKPKITIALKSKKVEKPLLTEEGSVLITHWGLSGPAILKLSAWGARILNEKNYKFQIKINWLPDYYEGAIINLLLQIKEVEGKKTVLRTHAVDLPRRLWTNLVRASGIPENMKWADVSKQLLQSLSDQLTSCTLQVEGKSAFKAEFVTAGGVNLKEINFKTFGSKLHDNLFFAGEVIDVDAITGGFNFQNAWTSGYIAAKGIVEK